MSDSTDTQSARRPGTSGMVLSMWIVIVGLVVGFGILIYQMTLLYEQLDAARQTEQERLFWTLCDPASPAALRTEAFTRLAAAGHSEWRSAVCQNLDLRGSNLDRARLRFADLTACDVRDSSLIEADLSGSRLRMADMSNADLSRANLDDAECLKATFNDAKLGKALMRSVSLEQAQAQNANFVLADLSEGLLLMADLSGADLTGADLTGATLESARLRGATLALTNFTDTDLTNADLTNSNWWRARGLTGDQLIQLAEDFSPTESADSSRIQDYLLWAQGFQARSESSRRTTTGSPNEQAE